MTEAKTQTVDIPGAVLTYDVRSAESGDSTEPVLLLIGSPMGAEGLGTLAGHFSDRTVVTYDPRGVERSVRTDGAATSTSDLHADDLHLLITALGAGAVDVFASSGGAVNALALVARYPSDVGTLVAHEPPLVQLVPDREDALAACVNISETYESDGLGPAMVKFIVLVGHKGLVPAGFGDQPMPDPASFGLPAGDDGSRDDALLGQNLISCTHYEPDFDALRAASTRILLAGGVESEGQLAYRGGSEAAARLGTPLVSFPSDHGGFLGGEYGGMRGDPDAFGARLREVLAGKA